MKKAEFTPVRYLSILFGLGFLGLLVSLVVSGIDFMERIVYDLGHFVDFFDHVRRFYLGLDSVYAEGMLACYPPLAYCLYYLAARILYRDNAVDPDGLYTSVSGTLLLAILFMLFAALFLLAFLEMAEHVGPTEKVLAVILLCSYPFWLAVERGNMSLLVLLLLMYALTLRRSERAVEREAALLLFAAAAALKFYPAIFVFPYLGEKRYKEAIRMAVYGLLFLFVPFLFFDGLTGLRIFLHNITAVGSGVTGVTITGICGRIGEKMGIGLAQGHAIGKILSLIYFGLALVVYLRNRRSWKAVAMLTSLMIIFVAASGSYCLVYWAIPFVYFLNEMNNKERYQWTDYLYATLFAAVFFAYPVRAFGSSGMLYVSLYLLLSVLLVEEALCMWKEIRGRGRPAGKEDVFG